MGSYLKRLSTLLLAFVLAVTFMPAYAYAEGDEWDDDDPMFHPDEMELIGGGEWWLYSDGEIQFAYNYAEIPDGAGLSVGIHNDSNGSDDWQSVPEDYYVNDESSNTVTITLRGEDAATFGANDRDRMTISLICDDQNFNVFWAAAASFEYREAREPEYDFEQGRDMLPGWEESVSGRRGVYADTDEYRDWYGEYQVTDVTVTEGEDLLEEFRRDGDGDDYWWYYRIKENRDLDGMRGTITFKVDYNDIKGDLQSYSFDVNVTDEVYRVDTWTEGSNKTLPGGSITVFTSGEREYLDEDGEYRNEDVDPEDIAWTIEDDAGVVKASTKGSGKITLKFKTLAELNMDDIWQSVRVAAGLKNGRASADEWLEVSSRYEEIEPFNIDLKPGQSTTQTFTVKRHSVEQGEETLAAEFTLDSFDYDERDFSITPTGEANTFNIKRLRANDCNFRVEVWWQEDNGGESPDEFYESREYWFGSDNYDLWSVDHDIELFTDAESAEGVFCLDNLGENWSDYLEFGVIAGRWEDNEGEAGGHWSELLGDDDLEIAYNDDGDLTVRLSKDFIAKEKALIDGKADDEKYDDIRVEACLYVKGAEKNEENVIAQEDLWFHFRQTECNYYDLDDGEVLPTQDWAYNKETFAWVRNSQYPDGEQVTYQITNVEIIEEYPAKEGDRVFELEENDDYWLLRPLGRGAADIRISYIDIEGNPQIKDATVRVVSDLYYLDLDTVDGRTRGHAGDTIELAAQGRHLYVDDEGYQQETSEGLIYRWEAAWGDESLFTLTPDTDDPSKCKVTLKAPEGAGNSYWEEFGVMAVLYDGNDSDSNPVSRADYQLAVTSEYTQIEPLRLENLEVGDSRTIELSTMSYKAGKDPKPVEGIQYRVFIDQESKENIEVTDRNGRAVEHGEVLDGNEIIVKRTGGEWTAIGVRAETAGWDGEDSGNGDIIDFRDYNFDYRNYWTWIDGYDDKAIEISGFEDTSFTMAAGEALEALIKSEPDSLSFEAEVITADREYDVTGPEDIAALQGVVKSAGLSDGKIVVTIDGSKIPEKTKAPSGKEFNVESITLNITAKRNAADGRTYILSKDEGLGRPIFVIRTAQAAVDIATKANDEASKAEKAAADAQAAAKKAPAGTDAAVKAAQEAVNAAEAAKEAAKAAKEAADRAVKLAADQGYAADSPEYTAAAAAAAEAQKAVDAADKTAAEAASQLKKAKSDKAAADKEAQRQGKLNTKLPKIKIGKPVGAKKSVTVKWTKLSKVNQKKVAKIEIWICPDKKFAAKDTVIKTAGKSKASLKVKGLKAKKKYYVKVRTIKTVNGVKTVSKWSSIKSFKTK